MARRILFLTLVALALLALTSVVLAHSFLWGGGDGYPTGDHPHAVPTAAGTCADPIIAGVGGQFVDDTVGHANNHNAYSCVGWDESGPEVIYTINVVPSGAPSTITAGLSDLPPGVDLDVFILSPGGCVAGSCANPGSYGDVTATAAGLPEGTYTIAVDGYQGDQGSYLLSVSQYAGPSPAYVPSNPSPAPGAADVGASSVELTWDGGHPSGSDTNISYYVYIREKGESIGSQAPCSPVQANGAQAHLSCSAGSLRPHTRYHWWIIAESMAPEGYGLVFGPFWEFTTLPDVYLPLLLRGLQ